MPPGVRTGVAVADALVVAARPPIGSTRRAVRDREHATAPRPRAAPRTRAVRRTPRPRERSRRPPPACGRRRRPCRPRGRPTLMTQGARGDRRVSRPSATPTDAHHVLGEALRSLDARGRRARTEHRDADVPELVADARDERRLRADHDQVDVERRRTSSSRPSASSARTGWQRPERGDSRVPGRGVQLVELGALSESFHASACSRPPEPTTRTLTRPSLCGAAGRAVAPVAARVGQPPEQLGERRELLVAEPLPEQLARRAATCEHDASSSLLATRCR